MIQVAVVENDVSIARALAGSLAMEEDMNVVGIGHNGLEALDLVRRFEPDVMLLDLKMPIKGGLQALREMKVHASSTEVLILTIHDDDLHLFTALQLGAKGYLLKEATLDMIAAGVREVARGGAAIPPTLAIRVLAEFQKLAGQPPVPRALYSLLTKREVEVLELIAVGKKNQQIADVMGIELSSVKKHVTNILEKLHVNNRVEAALIAKQSGLVSCQEIHHERSRSVPWTRSG